MFETDETVTPIVGDIFRAFGSLLDRGVYALLEAVYRLFFKISTFELITGATVARFFGRIQLIFGIFIMFQLAMTILKGIVSPDTFTNEKTGAGSLIIKVITALLILTMLVPINFPNAKNEYEKQISNNGILFGTLYSLQNRVLANNLIGKVIFGTSEGNATLSNPDSAARVFTSTIMKGFYRINLKPENSRTHQDGKEDYMITSNRMCPNYDYSRYLKADVDPSYIASSVNEKCSLLGDKYAYAYTFFISFVVGIVFIVLFVSFTFDVVVRAAKLALLRLIAPIPVISYMDPSGSKDSAFNSWVKTLTSTYIDLFTRLATIYFVLYIIEEVGNSGLFSTDSSIGIIGRIVVYIGLFIFAKQAPKFIKEVLGLKGDTGSLFGGLSAALGIGAIGVGALSGGVSGFAANYDPKKNQGVGGTIKNVGKGLLAGMAGGVGGTINAGRAALTGKEIDRNAVMKQVHAYNDKTYSNAADKSTAVGRLKAGAQSFLGFRTDLQKMDDQIKSYSAASEALGRITKAFDANGDYKFVYEGADIKDSSGKVILAHGAKTTLKDMNDLCNFYAHDPTANRALDAAKKSAQTKRFSEIRKMKREDIVAEIKAKRMSTNDLAVYDAGYTIYKTAATYIDEEEFARFRGPDGKVLSYNSDYKIEVRDDAGNIVYNPDGTPKMQEALNFGYAFKHDAGQAGKSVDRIKNSEEYAQATANAKRAAESQKK